MSARQGVDLLVSDKYKKASQVNHGDIRYPVVENPATYYTPPQIQTPPGQVMPQQIPHYTTVSEPQRRYPQQQQQQPQQPQQQQQQQQLHRSGQDSEEVEKIASKTTVLQFDKHAMRRLCIVPFLAVIIIGLLIAVVWSLQHGGKEHSGGHATPQTNVPHLAWSNTSENAQQVAKVYSIFYTFTITNFGEWEQIPAKGEPGIPGVKPGDFNQLVSIHSCCRTTKNFFICSGTTRIDSTAFETRVFEEDQQIYMQVFSAAKLLVGATCKLELEFAIDSSPP